jgi:DNA-binding response OmpR family regulator
MAHILLVDDQVFTREFLLYELTRMGHAVSCVNDRDGLFVFLEDQTPDLVLLDPSLNGLKGWDLLREIRSPGRAHIPTILFTSFETTLQDPRAASADGYVVKNVNTHKLNEKISEVLTAGNDSILQHHGWPGSTQHHPSDSSGRSLFAGQGGKRHDRP